MKNSFVKILSIVLVVLVLLCPMPFNSIGMSSLQADAANTTQNSRSSKLQFLTTVEQHNESSAKKIYTVADFQDMRNRLSGTYCLMNDIDLSGVNWTPIGTEDKPFSGNLYGNGHSIKNLTLTGSYSQDVSLGLFGYVGGESYYGDKMVIRDIKLENVTINASSSAIVYAGSFFGQGYAHWAHYNIRNCIAEGSITVTSSNKAYVGGIAGNMRELRMYHCVSAIDINTKSSSVSDVGGLIAYVDQGGIYNSCNYGDITSYTSSGINRTAGLVGDFDGGSGTSSGASSIHYCFNVGNIDASSNVWYVYAGGLVGEMGDGGLYHPGIKYCFNAGDVSATVNSPSSSMTNQNGAYCGGIVGCNDGTVNNVYNVGDVQSKSGNLLNKAAGDVFGRVYLGEYGVTNKDIYLVNNSLSHNGLVQKKEYTRATIKETNVVDLDLIAMSNSQNYPAFDFSSVWGQTSGYPFPTLKGTPMIAELSSGNRRIINALEEMNVLQNMKTVLDNQSFTIQVNALSSASTEDNPIYLPASKAEVSVYIGSELVAQEIADDSGLCTFTPSSITDSRYTFQDVIEQGTISAHFNIGNDLSLCSEKVLDDGTWTGEVLSQLIEKQDAILIVQEPRISFEINVRYCSAINKSELLKCLSEYVEEFAECTNAHGLIKTINLIPYASDSFLVNDFISLFYNSSSNDIFIFYDADAAFSMNSATAGLTCQTAFSYADPNYPNIIVGSWVNNYLQNAHALVHESGHMFFSFYDEYCYGKGYYIDENNDGRVCGYDCVCTDLNGDGIIDHGDTTYGLGEWQPDGVFKKPIGKKNYGVMDEQWKGIELSNEIIYGSTIKIGDETTYTKQYWEKGYSCELDFAVQFVQMAYPYKIKYTFAKTAEGQSATYSYSSISNVNFNYGTLVDYIGLNGKSINSNGANGEKVDKYEFSFGSQGIIMNYPETDSYNSLFLLNSSSRSFQEVVSNEQYYMFDLNTDDTYSIYLPIGDDSIQKECDISVQHDASSNEDYLLLSYDSDVSIDELEPITRIYRVIGKNNSNIKTTLQNSVKVNDNILFDTISWYKIVDDDYIKMESDLIYGEHNGLSCSCTTDGNGEYVLLAKRASYSENTSLQEIIIMPNNTQNRMLDVSFVDSNESNVKYEIYISDEQIVSLSQAEYLCTCDRMEDGLNTQVYIAKESGFYISLVCKDQNGNGDFRTNVKYIATMEIDTNNDGIPNRWANEHGWDSSDNIAKLDSDNDGLPTLEEYQNGTNPFDEDTDGDNVNDFQEIIIGLNPNDPKSDGETDDYIVCYGEPDVCIVPESVTINDNIIHYDIVNNGAGIAMHTVINLYVDDMLTDTWYVNLESKATVDLAFTCDYLNNATSNVRIEIDEDHITFDSDYSNNSYTITKTASLAFEQSDYTITKNDNLKLDVITSPDNCTTALLWKSEGSNRITVDATGIVHSTGIGSAKITVSDIFGHSAECTVFSVAFEGAEYSAFDSRLINNGAEVEIIGYVGEDKNISIPQTIGGLPVTSISSLGSNSIESVLIPETVTSISANAFNSLYSLQSINVNKDNTNYCSIDGVLYNKAINAVVRCPIAYANPIVLPDSVASVNQYGFYRCNAGSISGGENITTIAAYSFAYCNNLKGFNLSNVTRIERYAFEHSGIETITIPETATYIGEDAFYSCSALKSVNYNAINCDIYEYNATYIRKLGDSTFSSSVTEINIGSNVKTIPYGLFANTRAKSIIIPESVESIGDYAFYKCSVAESYVIDEGSKLKTVGKYAFSSNTKIKTFSIPDSVTSLGIYAFSSCSSLEELTLSENIPTIPSYMFSGCSKLTEIIVPNSVSSIGSYAFQNCTALVNAELPEKLTTINTNAFKGCAALGKTTVGSDVKTIGENAFIDCTSLKIRCYYKSEIYNYAVTNSIPYEVINLPATSISINNFSVVKGNTKTITFDLLPQYAYEDVSFTSSNTKVATIENGVLTAVACGKTTVTATTTGGLTDTCVVTVLGASGAEATDFDYTVSSDGTYITINGYTGSEKDIIIPDTLAGKPVTTISSTFSGCDFETITLGKNVSSVSTTSFNSNSALTNIYVAETNTAYKSVDGVLFNAAGTSIVKYPNGRTDETYIIPDEVTTISSYAFAYCNLKEITIPEEITSLGLRAFYGDDALEKVCYNAKSAKATALGTMCVFPDSVECFEIGDNVETLPARLFNNAEFEEVRIPNSVTSINTNTFYNMPDLIITGYNGSYAETFAEEKGYTFQTITCENCEVEEWTITKAATCTEDGLKSGICKICGKEQNDVVIPATGHSYSGVTTDPTCTEKGYTLYACSKCEDSYTADYVTELGHDFSKKIVDESHLKSAASCTAKAVYYYSCSRCETISTKDTYENGSLLAHEYVSTVVAPTCTEDGYTKNVCKNCSAETTSDIISKLGHTASDWITDKEATCTATGTKHTECSVCHITLETATVAKKSHSYTSAVTPPTCTQKGYITYTCSVCKDSYIGDYTNALGHNYVETERIPATCTEDGVIIRTCAVCEETQTEKLAKSNHYDNDGDGYCDYCGTDLNSQQSSCSHLCHKTGFMGFIWKIINLFNKLFKINQYCECGAKHW